MTLPLRPYQEAALQRFLVERRLVLSHAPGAGKTLTAIAAAQALNAQRILVVASALARPTWVREFAKWWPEVQAHGITMRRQTKSGTKKALAARDIAYGASVQVISYNLLGELDAAPRDIVIFDEVHALRNPLSKQSRIAKAYMRAHPQVPALALTATPVPTEVANVWNLVDTLWPSYLGKPTDTGDVSWSFRRNYQHNERNDYGTRWYGAKAEALPALRDKLAPIMHVVTEAEFAQFAPPLFSEILWIDDAAQTPAHVTADWLEAREAEGQTHVGVFTYLHATAGIVAVNAGGWTTYRVDGSMTPEKRAEVLAAAAEAPKALIIATVESVRESISLSFLKAALVFEFRTAPAQAVQFLGRFARADSKTMAPTRVQYAAWPADESRAEKLKERLDAVSELYSTGKKHAELSALMAPRPLTEERLENMFESMFSIFQPNAAARLYETAEDDE